MTPDQKTQFFKYGCASRCIIKLLEYYNKPMSTDAFVEKLSDSFPIWKTHCGLLMASQIIDLGREFGIFKRADTFRCKSKIKEHLTNKSSSGILLLTDRDWEDTQIHKFHCSIVFDYSEATDTWTVWTPLQSGGDDKRLFSTQELEERLAHFLVLF